MSSPLEKFILENRSAFDADSPDPRIWEKISDRLDPKDSKKEAPVRSMTFKRWIAVAAAVCVFGLTTVLYYTRHQSKTQPDLTEGKPVKAEPYIHSKEAPRGNDSPEVM